MVWFTWFRIIMFATMFTGDRSHFPSYMFDLLEINRISLYLYDLILDLTKSDKIGVVIK